MSVVTETLLEQLRQQLKQGTVVWYDPDETYLALAADLSPEQVGAEAIFRYKSEDGFIRLRHELEPIWGQATTPPRLLIYVPASQQSAAHALIEFEVAGVVMQPGQQPPAQNTALSFVARRALGDVLPPAALDKIIAEVKAGKWTLAELDRQAERGIEERAGVLNLIFDSGNLTDIALRFLTDPDIDAKIEAKAAREALAQFLSESLGIDFTSAPDLASLRAHLARQTLATEFILSLGAAVPDTLQTFPLPEGDIARQATADIAYTWRARRDLTESYVSWAHQVESELSVAALPLELPALEQSKTFLAAERLLQESVEAALLRRPSRKLLQLSNRRLGGFWAQQAPESKNRWEVIGDAAQLILEAHRIKQALKGKAWSPESLLSNYALGDAPWCQLDTAQRHLERDFDRFDTLPGQHDSLLKLVARARQNYADVAATLAERFVKTYEDADFELPRVLLQADIFHDMVAPAAQEGPVAYILVDALRFEMARELTGLFDDKYQHELSVALATPPTITDVGMAALMPGAEQGIRLSTGTGGKLTVVIADKTLKHRADRIKHFHTYEAQTVDTRLADLAPLRDERLSKRLEKAGIILVTATDEIDGLCENNPTQARRLLDDALTQLRRGLNTLFGLGVQKAIITADHGYLFFGEKLSSADSIPAPGGVTAALKRRVWVGRGGAKQAGVLRRPLSALGIGGDLELATPYSLSYFSVAGGSLEYFHGGLSLQEIAIPVLVVKSPTAPLAPDSAGIQWELQLGSRSISTRFFSVMVAGESGGLLAVEPPSVRVEVRTADRVLSIPILASYGFRESTRDVELRAKKDIPQEIEPNTITLMIQDIPEVDKVTVHLLDASTGLSLARIEDIPFKISI